VSSLTASEDAQQQLGDILEQGFEAGEVEDATVASSLTQAQDLWLLREAMSDAQAEAGASIKHDIAVAVSAVPEFIADASAAVAMVCPEARVACFGHMGDGNLHFNISQPEGRDAAAFLAFYPQVNSAVHDVVRAYDGSISAEHGIGQMKRDELAVTAPPVALDLMRRIKAAFDPNGIMNPGKVL